MLVWPVGCAELEVQLVGGLEFLEANRGLCAGHIWPEEGVFCRANSGIAHVGPRMVSLGCRGQ